jgi:hypothetical protein
MFIMTTSHCFEFLKRRLVYPPPCYLPENDTPPSTPPKLLVLLYVPLQKLGNLFIRRMLVM